MNFNECVKKGGKITTESEKESYIRLCEIDGKIYRSRRRKKKNIPSIPM